MGLSYLDLDTWQAWQNRRNWLRRLKARATGATASVPPIRTYGRPGERLRVLIAVDSLSPTSQAAVLEPLRHLADAPVGVASGIDLSAHLGPEWSEVGDPTDPSLVLSLGAHLPVARTLVTRHRDARHAIVQHGLLTPLSPPASAGADLLAWSAEDGRYWAAGRNDLRVSLIGSQLLWAAAEQHRDRPDALSAPPVYLGQLHGAELSRVAMARAALRFCRDSGATYRPHPSEVDVVSRLVHQHMTRRGVQISTGSAALASLDRPIVSIFSTGVLEGAALGLPTWVHFPNAPAWLRDFWRRYEMNQWGDAPTAVPSWARTASEPAAAVADWIRGAL